MSNYIKSYIIDDDPIQCFLNKKMMEDIGRFGQIECFPNGKIAYDEIENLINRSEGLPNLILLDINMPVMDGWEFIEQLQEVIINHSLPVYIITSSIDSRDIDRAASYGDLLAGYMVKPFSEEQLKKMLELD